ncbi:hypothetical protein CH311_04270 [Afifella marina DSM 2698]|nr:hypothetical protein CH311_04270 [Afifella marina DSM 2698]
MGENRLTKTTFVLHYSLPKPKMLLLQDDSLKTTLPGEPKLSQRLIICSKNKSIAVFFKCTAIPYSPVPQLLESMFYRTVPHEDPRSAECIFSAIRRRRTIDVAYAIQNSCYAINYF